MYFFDETGGTRALDHSGGKHHLGIPLWIHIIKKDFLAPPWVNFIFDRSFLLDVIVNSIGFIPFAFVLSATLIRVGALEKQAVLITIAFCFMVSLALEILQAWMPSRSSSMLDLGLNTLGACMGAFTYRFFNRTAYEKERAM